MQTSLVSLIQKHRPRRALLTSYAFSVSWFETFALPALTRHGCEQIDVLVDYRKANQSTQEAASQYAGTSYRIIPVAMEGSGIFHPKIMYLEGDDAETSDGLLIGTGNLTHGGQGKNLELFDGISHHDHPHVFGEFADFLQKFIAQRNFSPENLKALQHFEARSRAKGKTSLPPDHDSRTAWLIHTLTRPAAAQLADLAMGTLERPEELLVLAPYHSPCGGPVARLAKELAVQDVTVGLSASTRVAPFDESLLVLPESVRYVIPVTEDSNRFAHAKHFEVRSEEASLLMTGSVNATAQSLESLKNVEISLVRKVSVSMLDWEDAKPASFQACDFRDEHKEESLFALQASWANSNWVEGSITPARGTSSMLLTIWEGGKLVAQRANVELDAKGRFKVRMTDVLNSDDALVIELKDAEICVRGWLNMEYALSGSPADRNLLRSSGRLLAGQYSVDDLKALFSWMEGLLAKSSSQPHPTGKKQTDKDPAEDEAPDDGWGADLSYADWLLESLKQQAGSGTRTVAKFSIAAAFAWLNRDLPPVVDDASPEPKPNRSKNSDMKLVDNRSSDLDPDASAEGKMKNADIKGEELYNKLLENLPRALERDNSSSMAAYVVQLSGAAALKRTLSVPLPYPGQDPDSASALARRAVESWLTNYAKFDYSERNRHALLPFFCAMACCTLQFNSQTPPEILNEALQALARGLVSSDEVVQLGRMALSSDGFARVSVSLHDEVLAHAPTIANSMTATSQLTSLISELFTPSFAYKRPPAPYTAAFDSLKVRAQNPKLKNKKFGVLEGGKTSKQCCPCCNLTLSNTDMAKLRTNRVLTCLTPTCQAPVFYGLSAAELINLKLGDHFRSA
ncbi:hypothetical protein IFT43_02035 [Oxalobacteraceae sp. CFBP 13708]|nr:hypothetical protein [Oxalobacteraceae sp. CFBP 13708]